MNVLLYLLKVILCSGILFGYYYLFLRNKRFHHYNRFYLLAALALSMVLPLIRIHLSEEDGMLQQVAYRSVRVVTLQTPGEAVGAVPEAASASLITVSHLLWAVYGCGVLLLLVMLVRSLRYIKKLSLKYPYEVIEQLKLYQTNEPGTPFSFFRSIYWNEELNFNSVKGQQIFRHELFHVQQRHSADTIAAELITMFGWFNPFFYLIKRELKAIHEFLADQYAASGSNRYQYAELLVQQVMESRSPAITHPFFQNQLKRRIAMITQHHQSKYGYWSRVMVLPISVFLFFSVSLYAQERKADKQTTRSDRFTPSDQAAMNASLETTSQLTPEQLQPMTNNQDMAETMAWAPEGGQLHLQEKAIVREVQQTPVYTVKYDTVPGRKVVNGQFVTVADSVKFYKMDFSYDKQVLYSDSVKFLSFTTVNDKKMMYADSVSYSRFATVDDKKRHFTDSVKVFYFKADKNYKQEDDIQKQRYTTDMQYTFEAVPADTVVPKLQRYFNKNYRYPVEFLNNHGEGSVYYSFVLDEQGNLKDYEVYNSVPKADKIYEIVIVGYGKNEPTKTLTPEEKHAQMKGEVDRIAAKSAPIPGKFKPTRYYFKATWKVQTESGASKPITSKTGAPEKTYVKVDILPAYTGGANAWKHYLTSHLQYPAQAINKKVEGTVIVQFVVKKEGGIDELQSISGPDELKAEAYRLVFNSAANWKPAIQDGQAVRAYMKQPIIFKLQ